MNNTEILYRIYLFQMAGLNPTREDLCLSPAQIKALKRKEWIYTTMDGRIYITETGSYVLNDAFTNPYFNSHEEAAWIYEALTGTDTNGQETKITNPVIPKGKHYRNQPEEPDCDAYGMILSLAREYNKEPIDIAKLVADERVAKCSHCRKISIFRKSHTRTSGIQSRCIRCTKGE
jgi:hypothetical protein